MVFEDDSFHFDSAWDTLYPSLLVVLLKYLDLLLIVEN